MMAPKIRIARPVTDLVATERMYCDAFGLAVLYRFTAHDGFDGIMLGERGAAYHFEFTLCPGHPIKPAPTPEDLVVLYLPDKEEWRAMCERAQAAGFKSVESFNPYWDRLGRTYEDSDGYRIVLQHAEWSV